MADDLAKRVDFQKRRDAAVKECDAVFAKYGIGIILTISTGQIPNAITELKPTLQYYDAKELNERKTEAEKTNGKGKGKKGRR